LLENFSLNPANEQTNKWTATGDYIISLAGVISTNYKNRLVNIGENANLHWVTTLSTAANKTS